MEQVVVVVVVVVVEQTSVVVHGVVVVVVTVLVAVDVLALADATLPLQAKGPPSSYQAAVGWVEPNWNFHQN